MWNVVPDARSVLVQDVWNAGQGSCYRIGRAKVVGQTVALVMLQTYVPSVRSALISQSTAHANLVQPLVPPAVQILNARRVRCQT